ncbi:hypothetical protein A1Q1_06401 [Trichosporon asahii var. asahii CBS 2479]|uniref:Uncharacterized protein n=1 Tax=Trichosporon asahii var. asahii (strain ATCC 90039 / CBS 2479 / JCM 2466 / KCTC 7840 / NBRC 103889/ NCYC 2677 / UAMH 7654) TaxID=1186058 RepID=J5Q3D3_TRIAS|nr:hypothetical protein A1Q1_06401 [Trichosporon asahii var. asahii CBS 2479]EJT45263.1 hypothetical protein A1Q1_06401 [Trichosporon asahii var. asahii CBS 2479]
MPLARTPPRGTGNVNHRAHTFSPSQAYPDGVPPTEPAPISRGGGLARTPPPGAPQPQPTSRGKEKQHEGMDVEEERPSERRRSRRSIAQPDPPEQPEEVSDEDDREEPKVEEDDREGEEDTQDDRPGEAEVAVEIEVEEDVEVHAPPHTPPPQRAPSQPAVTPGRTPRAPRASYHPADPLSPDDPSESTRTPRTPRDRRMSRARTPAEVVSEPPVPIRDTDEAEYGKYYETLSRALRINTIDKGLSKLTRAIHCSRRRSQSRSATSGPTCCTSSGRTVLVPKRLRTLAQVVDEANAWKESSSEGRPDAWRPDLTPFTISTGTNLEVYDQSWAELREEYLALTKECGERMKTIQEKRERLANVDNGVSDSVVELAKVS